MPASALKAKGNSHLAKKEWEKAIELYTEALEVATDAETKAQLYSNRAAARIHFDKLPEALADVRQCISSKGTWSKGWARLAEVLIRQNHYAEATEAYEEAVKFAEDSATKRRYVLALKTTNAASDRHARPRVEEIATDYESSPIGKVLRARRNGYELKPRGTLSLLVATYEIIGAEGFSQLGRAVYGTGKPYTVIPYTIACQQLSECILLDTRAFIPPQGSGLGSSLRDRIEALIQKDFESLDLFLYAGPDYNWNGAKIIADLNRRLCAGEITWERVRRSCSVLSREYVLKAFINQRDGKLQNAVRCARFSIDILEEGNRVWPQVPVDDKGSSFRPTFVRLVKAFLIGKFLVHIISFASTDSRVDNYADLQVEAHRAGAFLGNLLETIERDARELIAANPQSAYPKDFIDPSRLAYSVLPTVRAHLALAYCYAQVAQEPLKNVGDGKAEAVHIDASQKAARYFELASKFLPDDDYRKPMSLFGALEQHLRAGGKKVVEIFKLAEEAVKLRLDLLKFYDELGQSNPSRDFVERHSRSMQREVLIWENGERTEVDALERVLKPIPLINMRGQSTQCHPLDLYREWVRELPGEVILFDVIGNERVVDGRYA
ncbi:hypothetical protein JCM3765_006335 [Sporobolomyces pararoseus]